jgi:hypothetical protein
MTDNAAIEIRGNGVTALISSGKVADLEALRDMPDLRHVWLDGISLTTDILRLIAGLPQLAALTITGARLDAEQFAFLDALPPGAAVKVESQDHESPVWNEFRRRRANRAARLSPDRRREAAQRYAQGIAAVGFRAYDSGRTVEISYGDATDDDIRLIRWLPEMETLQFHRCWGVTTAALRHLAGHPRLKTINLSGPKFTAPIGPLARCPALESLEFFPNEGVDPLDAHMVGLERMAGLRRLRGCAGLFTDATLARVGRLTKLRYLNLPLGTIQGDDSLCHLAGLRELEYLALTTPTPLSSECMRHLAGLTRLRALNLPLEEGDGDGLRHLSGVKDLQFLTLTGQGVTNDGLKHLHGLTNLKVVQVPWSRVTNKGASQLAEALPGVAVRTYDKLFKSPKPVVRFRRSAIGGFASALIPVGWPVRQPPEGSSFAWTEDGFEGYDDEVTDVGSVAPVEILLWVEDVSTGMSAATYLRECSRSSDNRLPKKFETEATKMGAGRDAAAAMFPRDGSSCLAGVAVRNGRAAAVQGEAPPGRFAAFRGLFAYIAASLRIGPEALVEEEVDVPSAELA